MNTDDMHVLAAAYTLDAIELQERREFEAHLESCSACLQEVAEFYETVGRLGSASAELPPSRLKVDVLNQIHNTRQAPPRVISERRESRIRRMARSSSTWVAAAAVVTAIAAGGYAWREHNKPPTTQVAESPVSKVLNASDARSRDFKAKGGGRVTIVRSDSQGNAVVIPNLPKNSAGKVYQYWVVRPGATTADTKIFRRPVATGKAQLVSGVRPTDLVAVSIEKGPNGAKHPTNIIVLPKKP